MHEHCPHCNLSQNHSYISSDLLDINNIVNQISVNSPQQNLWLSCFWNILQFMCPENDNIMARVPSGDSSMNIPAYESAQNMILKIGDNERIWITFDYAEPSNCEGVLDINIFHVQISVICPHRLSGLVDFVYTNIFSPMSIWAFLL